MKKIVIIGNFGRTGVSADGQIVKTVNLYNELSVRTDWDIVKVDTSLRTDHPLKLLIRSVSALIATKNIIVMLSTNGKKFFFPLLFVFAVVFKKNVYHVVNGGNLAMEVERYPRYRKYLNSFQSNLVETDLLKRELEQSGVHNVAIFRNFRRMEPLKSDELNESFSEPFPFCTFSMVCQEKGIEDAIHAVRRINTRNHRSVCRLEIYGPIREDYRKRFEEIMNSFDSDIQYCGTVPPDQAVNTLRRFYATLFPTHWKGEGNAGTITESFFAGVPVIATDWRCNREMIVNGYNGILYPSGEAETLDDGINWMIDHQKEIGEIKRNCLEFAKSYQPDVPLNQLISQIQETDRNM